MYKRQDNASGKLSDERFDMMSQSYDAEQKLSLIHICRMKANNELRYHIAAYTSTKNVAQQLKTAKRPAVFEEQHLSLIHI